MLNQQYRLSYISHGHQFNQRTEDVSTILFFFLYISVFIIIHISTPDNLVDDIVIVLFLDFVGFFFFLLLLNGFLN